MFLIDCLHVIVYFDISSLVMFNFLFDRVCFVTINMLENVCHNHYPF